MAILEQNPPAFYHSICNFSLSFLSLALSKRYHVLSVGHVHLLTQLFERSNRVRSRGEYENEWRDIRRVLVARTQSEGRRCYVLLSDLLGDVVLQCSSNLVLTNSFKHKHLLKAVKLSVPFAWKRFFMSVGRVKNLFELFVEADEVLKYTTERGQTRVHCEELLVNLHPLKII